MIILGIETSCDETAAAIVDDKKKILSNIVLSQLEEHAAFGGVVPEIAARAHLEYLDNTIRAAMSDAGVAFSDLDGVASTCGPGLIGGVIVGMMAGKSIAAAHDLPFIAVNHLEGHALTPRLSSGESDDVAFPYLLLLVSGGHTQFLAVEGVGQYKRLGTTLDDAAGECFDKSAKIMGLPFPGGPNLEKMARNCDDVKSAMARFSLPRPLRGRAGCDFSFSGLKTAVRMQVDKLPEGALDLVDVADLCGAFEETMGLIIAERSLKAVAMFKELYGQDGSALVVAGGVAANQKIRMVLKNVAAESDMRFVAPPMELCSDNAAMIAWAGLERLQRGSCDPLDVKARPRWPLDAEVEAMNLNPQGSLAGRKGVKA